MIRDSDQLRNALLFALTSTAATIVVLKMLTGLALAPLAVFAAVIFVIAFAIKLRVERTRGHVRGH